MNASLVRNACPTLARPMQTGDGLLARLNPVSAGIAPASMIGLAEAALRHGNGIMEVTQRGSLQIRGLNAGSAPRLAAEVEELGIAVRAGMPVETGPLAGLDPNEITDARPLAEAIRTAITETGLEKRLGPKVSVVVDGGGRVGLDGVLADVRLKAMPVEDEIFWRLGLAGDASTARFIGLFRQEEACDAVLTILHAVASLGRKARARDLPEAADALPPSGLPAISPSRGEIGSCSVGDYPISLLEGEMAGRPEGGIGKRATIGLKDSRFALPVGLPFGSMHAADLVRFIRTLGAPCEIRLAPQRRLLLLLPSQAEARIACRRAAEAGFITNPADNRLNIVACPGAPACASGEIAARDIARGLVRDHRGPMPKLHISGCAKRCAAPRHKGLSLIGEPAGISVVMDGEMPRVITHASKHDALAIVLSRLATEQDPARPDASLLRRSDAHAFASAFRPEP